MNLLHKLVDNKSVSLVGSLNVLQDTGLGKKIDSADVVIRMGFHWPACGRSIDATPDIGFRNDVVVIHEFTPNDIRKLAELLDLKLVVWFTESTKQTDRYLDLMNIKSIKMKYEKSTSAFTTVYLSLLESQVSKIFVCGKRHTAFNTDNRIFHENKDMRVECAPHISAMSIKI